jgi:hypothetical protein
MTVDFCRSTVQGVILDGEELHDRRLPMVALLAKTIVVGIDGSPYS